MGGGWRVKAEGGSTTRSWWSGKEIGSSRKEGTNRASAGGGGGKRCVWAHRRLRHIQAAVFSCDDRTSALIRVSRVNGLQFICLSASIREGCFEEERGGKQQRRKEVLSASSEFETIPYPPLHLEADTAFRSDTTDSRCFPEALGTERRSDSCAAAGTHRPAQNVYKWTLSNTCVARSHCKIIIHR